MAKQKINIVLYGIDKKIWDDLRKWCISQGIPISGRNSRLSEVIQNIIRKHIGKGEKESEPKDRIHALKIILDRNILPRKQEYIPPMVVDGIIRTHLNIVSPNLIRYYASLCGYQYDRIRKAYRTPYKEQKYDGMDEEAKKIIQATLQYAKQQQKSK